MEILLKDTGEKPIYEQITQQLKQQILSGALQAGDALPSMRLLAKELRISVITTKRAYEELERDGFVCTVPGKGSFVASTDRALLKEDHKRLVEQELSKVVQLALQSGISQEEFLKMAARLWAAPEERNQ